MQVVLERRPGIDDPARNEPGVGAGERERTRVVGADQRDPVIGQIRQRGTSR
jgi:hypothetical protein